VAFLPLLSTTGPVRADETIVEPFATYYGRYHGDSVLGAVNSPPLEIDGYRVQYFEKGRLEDHWHENHDLPQAVAYSRLTVELMQTAPYLPVDGLPVTYGDLQARNAQQMPPPAGFSGGTMQTEAGIFVPADPSLGVAPGYVVPFQFWTYINRSYMFPGGWMHDVGLPLTNAFEILVPDDNGTETRLIVQAFERTVLTLDLTSVYDWPVRRANIGTDAMWVRGETPMVHRPALPPSPGPAGAKRIEVDLAKQWLYAYEGDHLVMDVPVSTGKDGFETPPGRFAVYSKIALKTLRGTQNGETWNVPDVPHIMFYRGGFAIHGVYWHDRFGTGERHSHGCVGIAPYDAAVLYDWAPPNTPVIVY
jgi:hypothetical protein